MNSRLKRLNSLFILLAFTACSGSIFSEKKTPPTPPPNTPSTSDRPLVDNPNPKPNDGPGREIVANPTDKPSTPGRVVNDVNTLNVYEILAPNQVALWTERMNEQQQKDFLAKLGLNIVIGKAAKTDTGRVVRNVDFYISKDGKNVSSGDNPKAPWVSIAMEVNKDKTEDNGLRSFYASGYLQSPDYPAQESPFVALSLILKKSNNRFVMVSGKFIDYVNGSARDGYRIDKNTMIKLSIQ